MARIPVTKTPKVYVGGQFIRSESGRVFPVREVGGGKRDAGSGKREGGLLGNIPQCTRKDLRNAVEAAAKAGPDWAQRTPYNRGQILYRLGEMLQARSGVVNILTGFRKELVPTFATHTHIRGVSAVVNQEEKKQLQLGAAESIKRVRAGKRDDEIDWTGEKAQSVYEIRDFIEFKTTWHPIGA